MSRWNSAVLLVNTHSRSGRQQYARAHQALVKAGLRLSDVQPILRPGRLVEAVREAVCANVELVIVGGGDGTLSAAAHELAGTQSALGVLPMGTGNDFARSLNLPLNALEVACGLLLDGPVRQVDLGVCNGRHFLNAASMGLTVNVAHSLSARVKRTLGAPAYVAAAAISALTHDPFHLSLKDSSGQSLELASLQLVVGNGRFQGGGRLIAPEAGLEDSLLDVYAVVVGESSHSGLGIWGRARNLLALGAVGAKLSRGKHLEDARVLHFRAQSVDVDADPKQGLDVDGELWGQTPARFKVAARALKVVVAPP